jgi:hypothetical protein
MTTSSLNCGSRRWKQRPLSIRYAKIRIEFGVGRHHAKDTDAFGKAFVPMPALRSSSEPQHMGCPGIDQLPRDTDLAKSRDAGKGTNGRSEKIAGQTRFFSNVRFGPIASCRPSEAKGGKQTMTSADPTVGCDRLNR